MWDVSTNSLVLQSAIPFPDIDPVIFSIGPLAIRWYALAYIAGLLIGWHLLGRLNKREKPFLNPKAFDDFLLWAIGGIILGGRLGYVLFYNLPYYLHHPLEAFAIWQGGMSFHGGLIGAITAMYLMCKTHKLSFWPVMDAVSVIAPIGLFFGRIANFINGELYGRATDVSWAVIFPHSDGQPRHPSQLYEAALEGALLFAVLYYCMQKTRLRNMHGALSGLFLMGYGITRSIAEYFREPDAHIGFLIGGMTMGQLLSLPMILLGLFLVHKARKAHHG